VTLDAVIEVDDAGTHRVFTDAPALVLGHARITTEPLAREIADDADKRVELRRFTRDLRRDRSRD
jgi:hypothetical protein